MGCFLEEDNPNGLAELRDAAEAHAAKYGVTTVEPAAYRDFSFAADESGSGLVSAPFYGNDSWDLTAMALEDYNACAGTDYALASNEVLLYTEGAGRRAESLTLDGVTYEVAGEIPMPCVFVQHVQCRRYGGAGGAGHG